jgi:lipoprotein-releasing system permease protein
MRYEYFIGLRYLRAKRRQTFVSVITAIAVAGVTVGVAALIIVLSGMVGVQEYMRDKILGFNAHIIVTALDGIKDPEAARAEILKVPGVTGASPYVEGQVMIRGRAKGEGVLVRGIDPETVNTVMAFDGNSVQVQGSMAALADGGTEDRSGPALPALAIGQDLARELRVYYGEEVSLIVPEGSLTPLGMRPKVKRFRIGCIYKFGFYEVDSSVVLLNIEEAKQIFNTGGAVNGIEVKTDNIFTVDNVKKRIDSVLGPPFTSTTWFQQQKQLFAALKMEQLLSGLVLSLIMLVASFNIISMLLMLVMEKYRDIAILKSMGATDAGVMRIFMIQGTIIGVFGAALGVVLGLVVCFIQIKYHILAFDPEVYQFSVVPMKITWQNLLGVSIGAVLLSFLTTLYPSWQAARMKPAESLRYE